MERLDVAVVGLGALGSTAAYQAAVKGAKVIGFEQFELGHVRGASRDTFIAEGSVFDSKTGQMIVSDTIIRIETDDATHLDPSGRTIGQRRYQPALIL